MCLLSEPFLNRAIVLARVSDTPSLSCSHFPVIDILPATPSICDAFPPSSFDVNVGSGDDDILLFVILC